MDNKKIAIVTTVINCELYKKSSQFFPEDISRYVIDGRDGMYGIDSIFYMLNKFKNKDFDWLIMADEDVLFLNPKGIYEIIDEMIENDFIVSGVRDGGDISIRSFSPYVINTFFSIINLKKLKKIWDKKDIAKNQYIDENEFEEEHSKLMENYDKLSLYEPYYCFYFWLRRKGEKILFLNAKTELDDKITTSVFSPKSNSLLLYHTWYARSYGINEAQTNRINRIFYLLDNNDTIKDVDPIVWKDKLFFIKRFVRKQLKRVSNKLKI
jgi:hypothetical protein